MLELQLWKYLFDLFKLFGFGDKDETWEGGSVVLRVTVEEDGLCI